MLSILIPVYNYPIKKLVAELYRQAEKLALEYEILIADDSSTQQKILKEIESCKQFTTCKVHHFEHNKGRTFTRNYLAKKAQSGYLLFLDADVIPKNSDFIETYIKYLDQANFIFGGNDYRSKKPPKDQLLRWRYGKIREVKSVAKRNQNPYYTIISQAFVVEKSIFLKANKNLENLYGMDGVFAENLKNLKADILHIDNPVIHLGLENNRKFLKKTMEGLQTLAKLENEHEISKDYRPVQKTYHRLKKNHLVNLFLAVSGVLRNPIKQNLLSGYPSLFLFDIYKLDYFARLKKAT